MTGTRTLQELHRFTGLDLPEKVGVLVQIGAGLSAFNIGLRVLCLGFGCRV